MSTKIPAKLLAELDEMARLRGVSRSFLIRELVEAAVEGRVALGPSRRKYRMTIGQLGASDVGVAARQQAQRVAEVACDGGGPPPAVQEAAFDVDAVARRAARLLAEGR